MKNLKRSVISILVMLLLVASSFIPSYAAEAAQPASYSTEYNSGQREVVCTTLDGTSAEEYYSGYEYDTLSNLSSNALLSELNELMTDTHTYISSYDDCHYKADRTDCQNGDGSVSLIYTAYSATMDQWNGWNREHVWPQSLGGDNTNGGGADLHHIRPSDAVVNSTRGNKKYGNTNGGTAKYGSNPASGYLGGYYDSSYFEPVDSVKGDVARICLYVYARWGSDWGADNVTKVFESVDVLLAWCEMDPVDTWEMGRNEVVEDIQGNRNVFIDYPEYAWLIFDREVPDDMVTPSGEAMDGTNSSGGASSGGTVAKPETSTAPSSTTTTATLSISSYASANGWTNQTKYTSVVVDENITATASGSTNTGRYYTSGTNWRLYQSESAKLTLTAAEGCTITSVKITYTSDKTGVLKYNSSTVSSGSALSVNASSVVLSVGNSGSATNGQVRVTAIEITYTQTASCSHANKETSTTPATCTVAGSTTVTCIDCKATISETPIPATGHQNTSVETVDATCTTAGSTVETCDDCGATLSSSGIPATGHNYVDNRCTNCGAEMQTYSYSYTFVSPTGSSSGETNGSVTMNPAPTYTGYTFVGWSKSSLTTPSETAPTLYQPGQTLTITENTTFYAIFSYTEVVEGGSSYVKTDLANIKSTDSVVITMTKGSTTWALTSVNGSSSAPTAVVVTASNGKLTSDIDSNLLWNISNNSGTLTIYVNGTTSKWLYCTSDNNGVRVGTNANKTFTIDSSSGYLKHTGTNRYVGVYTTNPDWRCYTNTTGNTAGQTLAFYVLTTTSSSETYYVTFERAACQHDNTSIRTVDATCTEDGSRTEVCDDCGITVSEESITATGHTAVTDAKVDATCTESGLTEGSHCSTCSTVIVAQETIAALGHNYTDGTCSICGEAKPADPLGLDGNKFYIATIRTSGNYWYMTNNLGTAGTKRYQAVDSGLTSLPASINTELMNADCVFVFEYNGDGTYSIYAYGIDGDAKYLGHTGDNSGLLVEKAAAVRLTVTSLGNGVYNVHYAASDAERYLALNSNSGSNYFAFYKSGQKQNLALIPVVESTCEHTSTTEIVENPTCIEEGLRTVVCNDCDNVILSEVIPANGHDSVDGICSKCGYTDAPSAPVDGGWTLVTDVSQLKPGDQIVIVANGADLALSTTQNNNNRGVASITKNGNTVTFGSDVQILTVMAGKVDGTFAFYTGSGYLYAASSSSNYLKTEATLSANSSWTITIADGVATVKSQGTYTHNWLRYNSGSNIFSCYESGQQDIAIYKLESGSASEDVSIHGASMTVGSTLAMNYYIQGCIGTDYYMIFSMNGNESEKISGTEKYGYLVFSFENIPPQCMGDVITATLYNGDDEVLIDSFEFSVKEYAEKVLEIYKDRKDLTDLVADMLKYGAAAQVYTGHKADSLVTEGMESILAGKGSTATPEDSDNIRVLTTEADTEIDTDLYSFTSAGVRFDFDNKIYVKFKIEGDGIVSIKCNGKYTTRSELSDGIYIAYTDGISATSFDKAFTFEIYVDNILHQTITYSVNSYVYAKQSSTTPGLADLVLALYRYGISAKNYTE